MADTRKCKFPGCAAEPQGRLGKKDGLCTSCRQHAAYQKLFRDLFPRPPVRHPPLFTHRSV
jgi:hypothetical protein